MSRHIELVNCKQTSEMSVASKNSSKKMKKKKKEKSESPYESESSEEELDLTKEIHPIGHYINDRPEMINQMFSVIKGNKLKTMLPPLLKDYDVEKLKLQCLDQLLGMSEKRITCLLEGEILETSSESSVSSNEDSENSSVGSQQKKRKSESGSVGNPSKAVKIEDPAAPEKGKTLLEILELEMRARAIRALLKQGNAEVVPAAPAPDNNVIDLTDEQEFPTVIKVEPPSEQETSFEAKVTNSVAVEKTAEKKSVPKETELRNKIMKKKIYRTRLQRLANEDVPKIDEPVVEPVVQIKEEPLTIEVEEPEEGEVSSGEDVAIKEENPESPELRQVERSEAEAITGERICEINDGVFVADENVPLPAALNESDVECVINLEEDQSEAVIIDLDDDSLDNMPEEINATTWRERWLQNDQVQKVVNTSKLVGLVKKRLAQKKTNTTESETVASPSPVPDPPIAVLEGRVSEYQQLKEQCEKKQPLGSLPSDHPVETSPSPS